MKFKFWILVAAILIAISKLGMRLSESSRRLAEGALGNATRENLRELGRRIAKRI